jgi:Ca2+-binding RTX toxin-like protein
VDRQAHLIVVVRAFLIGCAVFLVVVGCSGVRSEAPQEKQERAEATKEQTRSPDATASEAARCERTRTFKKKGLGVYTTNDVPGCPKGGLLSGTDKIDNLDGKDGDDEIRGLGAMDFIDGGLGSDAIYGEGGNDFLGGEEGDDVLYGGDGDDHVLHGGEGEDVLYGGDGNDYLEGRDVRVKDTQRDELYCGAGKDRYNAGRRDRVSSSCEEAWHGGPSGPL